VFIIREEILMSEVVNEANGRGKLGALYGDIPQIHKQMQGIELACCFTG